MIFSFLFFESSGFTNSNEITEDFVKPIWFEVIKKYKQNFNLDLSDHSFKLSSVPYFINGKVDKIQNPDSYGGCWTESKIVYLNPNPSKVIKYYHAEEFCIKI